MPTLILCYQRNQKNLQNKRNVCICSNLNIYATQAYWVSRLTLSIVKLVWAIESSTMTNDRITVCPVYGSRLNVRVVYPVALFRLVYVASVPSTVPAVFLIATSSRSRRPRSRR